MADHRVGHVPDITDDSEIEDVVADHRVGHVPDIAPDSENEAVVSAHRVGRLPSGRNGRIQRCCGRQLVYIIGRPGRRPLLTDWATCFFHGCHRFETRTASVLRLRLPLSVRRRRGTSHVTFQTTTSVPAMVSAILPDSVAVCPPGIYTGVESLNALLDMTATQWRQFVPDRVIRKGFEWYRTHRITEFEADEDEGCLIAWFDRGAKEEPAGGLVLPVINGQIWPKYEFSASNALPQLEDAWAATIAAVVYFQSQRYSTPQQMDSAAEMARADRAKRALDGIATEAPANGQVLGMWHAWTVGAWRPGVEKYQVFLRSLHRPINGCTCRDFQFNELGTCKHIEAALVQARRMKPGRNLDVITMVRRPAPEDQYAVQAPSARAAEVRLALKEFLSDAEGSFIENEDAHVWTWWSLDRARWTAIVEKVETLRGVMTGRAIHLELQRWNDERAADMRRAEVLQELENWDGTFPWLKAKLYPYQVEGVRHLVSLGSGMIGDAMGLGKTMQAIVAFRYLMERGEARNVLVVCPTSLMNQWRQEIYQFTGMKAELLAGNSVTRRRLLRQRPPIVITSYERLAIEIQDVMENFRPDVMVADEAQKFRNFRTKAAQAVSSVPARFRILLSGTAMENRLTDFFSLMQVVDPTVFGPLWRFMQEFHVLDGKHMPIVARNLDVLRQKASRVFLRRTRDVIADQLPDRQDIRLLVPMTEAQQEYHDMYVVKVQHLGAIANKRPLSPPEQKALQAAILGARRACNHAGLFDPGITTSPKVELLTELLEQICVDGDEKVVVFSEWIQMGELAYAAARSNRLKFLHLTGSVPADMRPGLIGQFMNDPETKVLFASDAGATGLNLQAASVVIHLDQPWNPAILAQRSARVDRMGQKKGVRIYSIIADHSYELHVEATLKKKAALGAASLDQSSTVTVVGGSEEQVQELAEQQAATVHDDIDAGTRAERARSARLQGIFERLQGTPGHYAAESENQVDFDDSVVDGDAAAELSGHFAVYASAHGDGDEVPVMLDDAHHLVPDVLATLEQEGAEETSLAELSSPDLIEAAALIPVSEVTAPPSWTRMDVSSNTGEIDDDEPASRPAAQRTAPRLQATSQHADNALAQTRKLHHTILTTLFAAGQRRMAMQQLVTAEVLTLAAHVGVTPPADPMTTSTWLLGTVASQGTIAVDRAMLLSTAAMTLALWNDAEPPGVTELWAALVG